MRRTHSIRIPVHGFIEFDDWERDIINHPVFQRLRRIRQLAFSDHLYPGSTHTRFEHSLGVMHVATRLFDAIETRYRHVLEDRTGYKPGYSNARRLVRLAALLHDVGHAPFSHTGEDLMPRKAPGKSFAHEDYSAELIRHEMKDVIDNHEINRKEHNIAGADVADFYMRRPMLGADRLFWRVLVDGKLDADRMDYLLRDSYHCGVAYGRFDLDRIVDTIALVANESKDLGTDLQIGISSGGRHAAEGMILARYFMFQQVYFHPVRKAYDHHASQCLLRMLQKRGGNGRLPSPMTSNGRKRFLKLDDWTVLRSMGGEKGDRHTRAILTHSHDRCVAKTPEIPSLPELHRHGELLQALKEEGLQPWEFDADKEWYKVGDNEIQIVPTVGSLLEVPVGDPLSRVSNVLKNISGSKQRLIFVPKENRKRAQEVIKGHAGGRDNG